MKNITYITITYSGEKQRKIRTLSTNLNIGASVIHKLIRMGIIVSNVNLIISAVSIVIVIYT